MRNFNTLNHVVDSVGWIEPISLLILMDAGAIIVVIAIVMVVVVIQEQWDIQVSGVLLDVNLKILRLVPVVEDRLLITVAATVAVGPSDHPSTFDRETKTLRFGKHSSLAINQHKTQQQLRHALSLKKNIRWLSDRCKAEKTALAAQARCDDITTAGRSRRME